VIGRREWWQRHPKAKPGAYGRRVRAQRQANREATANWTPVTQGPPPPGIMRQFRQAAQRETSAWLRPRQASIRAGTSALAAQLAPIQGRVQAAYGQAQQGQAASDAALAQMLSGGGQQLAGDLSAQLAAAGQSTAPGQAQLGIGSGASGAAYAMGAANLGQLLAQGAAAGGFAAQLPGIARLGGAQSQAQLQGQGLQMTRDLQKESFANELEKWIARTGLGFQRTGLREEKRQFNVGVGERRREQRQAARQDALDRQADVAGEKAGRLEDRAKFRRAAYGEAQTLASKLYGNGRPSGGGGGGGGLIPGGGGGTKGTKVPREEALRRVRARLRGELPSAPPNVIEQMARRALRAAGYVFPAKPGGRGTHGGLSQGPH
jgi:hypothetical protein